MVEIVIWSQDDHQEEIRIRCVKAVEKFWRQGLNQLGIEVRASHPGEDFPFALAAVYETPGRAAPIARKLVEETLPRLRYCSVFFYEEVRLRNTEGLPSREEVERELQKNLEWAKQRTFEKLPAVIKEDVEKGKELRVLLNTWILRYARDHGMIYVLDAYDSHHEAAILMDFLQAEASWKSYLASDWKNKQT